VVAEVFPGLRREKERQEPASVDVYCRAAEIYRSSRQKGRTVRSTMDCPGAAIAEENGCHVLAA
jgi:predicted nucleic acid-binding protein